MFSKWKISGQKSVKWDQKRHLLKYKELEKRGGRKISVSARILDF